MTREELYEKLDDPRMGEPLQVRAARAGVRQNSVLAVGDVEASPFWDVTETGYFADCDWLSASMLTDFKSSVPYFAGRYITKTIAPKEPTAALIFGTFFHAATLEPDKFESRVVAAPVCDMRTKAGKATYESFAARNAGKEHMKVKDYDVCLRMRDAVLAHAIAGPLLGVKGRTEQAIRWDDASGLPCKAKIDRLADRVMIDLKSAADPTRAEWSKAAANYDYHLRAAHYLTGGEALDIAGAFLFIVCGKEEPYEVGVYTLDSAAIQLGHERRDALLRELQVRASRQDWSSRMAGSIEEITFPRWAFNN